MKIGLRMKERRKELKISADELAKKLGKDRSTIYRYEKGDIENLPLDILEPIAEALETTPAHLMGWDQEQIDALTEIENDRISYVTETESNLISLIKEFTENEMAELLDYAKYIISKRK